MAVYLLLMTETSHDPHLRDGAYDIIENGKTIELSTDGTDLPDTGSNLKWRRAGAGQALRAAAIFAVGVLVGSAPQAPCPVQDVVPYTTPHTHLPKSPCLPIDGERKWPEPCEATASN